MLKISGFYFLIESASKVGRRRNSPSKIEGELIA